MKIRNKYLDTAFNIIRHCGRRLIREHITLTAAGIAFYTIFSLFPLLMIIIVISSHIVEATESQSEIINQIIAFFPSMSRQLIHENILHILEARGTIGVISTLTFIWSSFSGIAILVQNINKAWTSAPGFTMFRSRLYSMIVVLALLIISLLFVLLNTSFQLLDSFRIFQRFPIVFLKPLRYISGIIALSILFFCLMILYFWIPKTRVRWREAAIAAGATILIITVTSLGFNLYMDAGISRYNIVYGSIGTVLAFMLWIYLLSFIVLFGAYLSASIAHQTRLPLTKPEKDTQII